MKIRKLLAILFASVWLLCGCNNTNAPTTNEETSAPAPADICLYENGTPIYSLVRPDGKDEVISEAVSTLWKTLMNTYACELTTNSDWVADPSEIPAGTPEILIGLTNRPESAEVAASLNGIVYRVTIVNNRIVLVSSSTLGLKLAVNAFLDTVVVDENGRVTVPGDLDILCTNAQAWEFDSIPVYDSGVYNGLSTTWQDGSVYGGWEATYTNTSHIFGISQTNAEEFNAYIEKVKAEGFIVVQRADWGNVLAYQCDKDDVSFYTYYTDGTKEVRIVEGNLASIPLEEFNYTYEPKEGETNDVYIYGLFTNDGVTPERAQYSNNGQLLLVKLADNSLFVIDGGLPNQVDPDQFITFAREITGIPEGEKVRIACWFITHCHWDHYDGFWKVATEKSSDIVIERLLTNFLPGDHNFDLTPIYPGLLYHKPHTGETIELGGTSFDILFTQEDSMNITTMEYLPETPANGPQNSSSTVMKIHFDGKTCIILGDIDTPAVEVIEKYYTPEQLKSDVMQVAHHGYNAMHNFYEKIDAKIALFPERGDKSPTTKEGTIQNSVQSICDEVYFGGIETVGVRVVDSDVQAFYRKEIVYN